MKRILLLGLVLVHLADAASAFDVFVRSPRAGEVAFGEVEIQLEILANEPVAEVVVVLDGREVARLDMPPFETTVDVGQENVPHTFEITVTDTAGTSVTRTVTTAAIAVNEELDLDLQQLFVTASRGSSRVLDLREQDFAVIDAGQPQSIVTFERGDVPLTAVLLIDSSRSMEGAALSAALAGAAAFVESMAELDQAKVLVFSDRLLAATPFTGDPQVVSSSLAGVRASGGTAIHDHLYMALKELDPQPGRQVIVLLSDGIDGESVLEMADVAWKAGRKQSLIYWIRPSRDATGVSSIWRNVETQAAELAALEKVVKTSGGRVREIERIEDAATAFREILQELREQYVIGYYPSLNANDGAWHEVRVRVRTPGVQVRSRGGYFDDQL